MFVDMLSKTTSNVSVNKHLQIVDAGAMEFLITIACADSLNVQRQALNTLRGLRINYEYRALVEQSGILDLLVLIAWSENIDIVREVGAALNCLPSVPKYPLTKNVNQTMKNLKAV